MGDPNTQNDIWQADCECNGAVVGAGDCDTYSSDDFNVDLGFWNDGGSDCAIANYSSASPFDIAVRIRDNSSGASSLYTDVLDLSNHSEVSMTFDFYPTSMETGEDFFLEVSTDGGATYTILEEWNSGVEFQNLTLYSEAVAIPAALLTQTTTFRFRCDASSNYDIIYLDNIIIESCPMSAIDNVVLGERKPAVMDEETSKVLSKVFPNPTTGELNIQVSEGMGIDEIVIMSSLGQEFSKVTHVGSDRHRLDVTRLESNQVYLIKITSMTGEVFIEHFLKL